MNNLDTIFRKSISMVRIRNVLMLLIASYGFNMSGQSQDVVDASTLNNKIMAGYQGWFAAEGDGSGVGWRHWGSGTGSIPGLGKITIDLWPDMREYEPDELFATEFTYVDGTNAGLYSAYTPKTVDRHVKWMKDYGIDGVFVQRFIGNTLTILELRDQVLQNIRYASETHGRVFANMYDISGGNPGTLVEDIKNDWMHLVDDLKITESPNYLHHNGRPVLSVWGLGHRLEFSMQQAMEIIQWLKVDAPEKYRVTLKGGIDNKWQSHSAEWQAVYEKFDIISPWAVGRYKDNGGADTFRKTYIEPDLAKTQSKNIDYMPVVFPGFSWFNNKPFKDDGVTPNVLNATPRNGGDFFWHQIYNAIDAGCKMVYVAMFDEVDEGTAIFKLAENTDQDPVETAFVTLDMDGYEIPGDWYLRLTGEGSKMLRGEIPISSTKPISPTVSGAEIISQNAPTIITPGTVASVSITVKNTGKTSWTKAAGFQLGSQNSQDNTIWGINRVELDEGETIAPGQNKIFTFDITAPAKASVYNFRWRMKQDGVNWFGYLTDTRFINVTNSAAFLDDCDALTNWSSTVFLILNSTDKQQGINCIEFTGSTSNEFIKVFSTPYNSGISANNAVLQFWYYVSDASKSGGQNKVEIGSAGKKGENVYSWTMSGLTTGWNLISLKIKDAVIGGTPDFNAINWFNIENPKTTNITTRIDEIQLLDMNASVTKYELKVNNGRGSGYFVGNEVIKIVADEDPDGYRFNKWVINSGITTISNADSKNPTLVMTPGNIEVTATYKVSMNYLDDCDEGTGWQTASYITLNTSDHKQGTGCLEFNGGLETTREFYKSFPNPYNPGVTVANGVLQFWYYISDISVISSYGQVELGSGGTNDVDEYNWKLQGKIQNGWNLLNLNISDAGIKGNPDLSAINWFRIYSTKSSPITSRIDGIKVMKNTDLNKYTLLVNNGSGSGIFNANQGITITANSAPVGKKFDSWVVNSGGAVITDKNASTTILTMPAIDVSVMATYNNIQTKVNTNKSSEQPISIYPNPSNGQFHIVIPENFSQSKYEIYNIMGSLVKTGYFKSNFVAIDMKNFSIGTYILRVKTEAKVYAERLIFN